MKIVKFQGGLGNQMFQYALYERLKLLDKRVYADISFYTTTKSHNGYELENIFKIDIYKKYNFIKEKVFQNKKIMKKIRKFYKSKVINQNDVFYDECILEKYIIFDGYWQSEKFFKDIESTIRRIFTFPEIIETENIEIKNKIESTNSVAIHIRRGDYIENTILSSLASVKYYEDAIEYIKNEIKNPIFFIFSDDIKWCKENLKIKEQVYYIDWNKGKNSYRDMQLMSLCKHNIIPNSSFSWWGAWLNKNLDKIVIAPEVWFRKETNYRYEDIVPENWIKMKNTK